MTAGWGFQGFASQTGSFSEFSGYALNAGGSVGPVGVGGSLNTSDQATVYPGAALGSPKEAWRAGASMYSSQTYGFTIGGR